MKRYPVRIAAFVVVLLGLAGIAFERRGRRDGVLLTVVAEWLVVYHVVRRSS